MTHKLIIIGLAIVTGISAAPIGRYQAPLAVNISLEESMVNEKAHVKRTESGWNWILSADQTKVTLSFDLDKMKINPAFYDEIQVRFRCRESLVSIALELQDYPVKDLRRSWYSKIAIKPGAWNDWRVDMKLDDDSFQENHQKYSGRKLNITLQKRYLRIPGEPPSREVDIAEIRFLRRPVDIEFDEFKAEWRKEKNQLVWNYFIEVFNRELKEQTVELRNDCSRLKEFAPSWQSKIIKLKPRERISIPLSLSIPEKKASALPVLYSESILPFMKVRDAEPAIEFYPVLGYRPRRIWAVIPPVHKIDIYQRPTEKQQKNLIAAANAALNSAWGIPEFGPAQHPSAYLDKKNNSKLKQLSWFRHQSLKTGEEITDDKKLNQGNIISIHQKNFERALLLGHAWRESGNVIYAEAARDVFLEYARVYPTLGVNSFYATAYRTRLGQSSLMTSFWFTSAINAYAAIRESAALSNDDRQIIEECFLAPELAVLYGHNIEFTNMQVHHYQVYARGVSVIGKHWNLLGEALYGDHGFYEMIEHSFSEDGMSQEGNVYHIFALNPLLDFARQMRLFGIEVMNRRFKRIFDGMVENTPDGIVRGDAHAKCLLDAWNVYRDTRYLPTLRHHKLLNEPGGELLTVSSVQENNGFVWLREKSPYGFRAVSLNYIMALDRMEYDRLHFSMFDPELLNTEVWRISYGSPQSKLMERTVSHNTVTVDMKDQADVPAKLATFIKRPLMPGALFTEANEAPLYSGVAFSRVAAIFDGIMFIGDLQDSRDEHTYDWPLYSVWEPWSHKETGWFEFPFELKNADTGYPFMIDAKSATTGKGFSVIYGVGAMNRTGLRVDRTAPNRYVRVTFGEIGDTEVFSAKTPRGHLPEPGPVMMLRQRGKSAAFAAAFEVLNQKNEKTRVNSVENIWRDGVNGAWLINADSGRYLVIVNRTGNKIEIMNKEYHNKLEVIKL